MRLTKNVKKILAATLSMALVVSGVTVGTKQAKAADALKWTGSFTMGTAWEGKAIEVKTDEGSTIEIKGNDYNNFEADFKVDLSAFTDPVITVTATEASDGAVHNFAVCNANNWSPVYAGVNENDGGVPADTKTITGKLDKAVTDYVITAQGRTVSNITITDGGTATDMPAAPSATPEATPAVTTPSTNTPSEIKWTGSFTMGTSYEAKAIEVKTDEGSTIEIKGNDYNNFEADFKVDLSAFTDPVITVTATEASDGAVHNFAVCNANNWSPVYAGVNENDGGVPADTKTITGKLDKAVTDYVITAQGRTVSNITITDGGVPAQTAAPEATVTPGVTTAPAVTAAPAETTAPTTAPSEATPTPDAVQTPAPDNTDDTDNTDEEEASLTVAKKTVSIKAGKSVTVKYTAINADGDAVKAKATSANKKVAKVKVSSKKAIKITVPKNVKKGKKAVVTVKAAGKTAKIKVKVK